MLPDHQRSKERTVFVMRHGRPTFDVHAQSLSYQAYMAYLLKRSDPDIDADHSIPELDFKPEIIFHSGTRRARGTAQIVAQRLGNVQVRPMQQSGLASEVQFSPSILSRDEFDRKESRKEVILSLVPWCFVRTIS